MGSISIPTMMMIASVASSAAMAYESHEAGVAAANADKAKARIAGEQATQQQIGMRQKMLSAMASQNAAAGAGGGSVSKANTLRQITQAQNDLLVNKAGASAQVSLLDQAGRDSIRAGNLGAASDLASGAASVAGSGAFGGAPQAPAGWSPGADNMSYAQQVKAGF
jgi:hypothetical protein